MKLIVHIVINNILKFGSSKYIFKKHRNYDKN